MDKYHIYEEIGKGEFSQVFKGREKKKIEYVAIKRIEKSVMAKVIKCLSKTWTLLGVLWSYVSLFVCNVGCQRGASNAQVEQCAHAEVS